MKQVLAAALIIFSVGESYAQNIGVGTTAPLEKLHVAGNVRSDTIKANRIKLPPDAGEGKILTSDAAGNGTWQDGSRLSGNIGYGVWGDCATNANVSEFQPVADSTEQGDNVGRVVAISGNFAVLGCGSDDVNGNTIQGSANIYEFNGSNWVFKQKITDPAGATGDQFGLALGISGNYMVIASPNDDVGANSNQGTVSVFRYNGSSWVFMQKLTDAAGAASDLFGSAVAISGNYIIVGSPYDHNGGNSDQGSACIFRFNGTSWVLMQKIVDALGEAYDQFGKAVAITPTHAFVGSPYDDQDAGVELDKGRLSIYYYNGSTWNQTQRILATASVAGDHFGSAISVSGNNLVVGSELAHEGSTGNVGKLVFYRLSGLIWNEVQIFFDPDGNEGDMLGSEISISGNYAIAGIQLADLNGNFSQGKAILLQKIGNYWRRLQQVTDPAGIASDYFGSGVGIDGSSKRFIIGAVNLNSAGGGFFGKVN